MTDIPQDPVQRVNFLRQKVIEGQEISDEELQEAISLLRSEQTDNIKQDKVKASLPEDLRDMF